MMKMRPSLRAGDAGWGRGGRFEWCQQRRQSWSCKHNSINLWTGPTNHRSMGISRALWQGQNQLRRGGTSRCPQIECPHSSQGQKATGILMGKRCSSSFSVFLTSPLSIHTRSMTLPWSKGPKCSAAGDGGGEGGRFAESSTANKQKKRRDQNNVQDQINTFKVQVSHCGSVIKPTELPTEKSF